MIAAEWFHNHGVGVFPLIRGTKQPKVSFPTHTCTSAQAAIVDRTGRLSLAVCSRLDVV